MQRLPKGIRTFGAYIEYDNGNTELKLSAVASNADIFWLNNRTKLGLGMLDEIGMPTDNITKITSDNIRRAPEYENRKLFNTPLGVRKHKYIWVCTLKLRRRHDERDFICYITADE